MDQSNVGKIYIGVEEVKSVQEDNIELSKSSLRTHEQFVANSITMANSWLGASGDAFLFSANTVSGLLAFALNFFDVNSDLLKGYELTFSSIDDQLAQRDGIELN